MYALAYVTTCLRLDTTGSDPYNHPTLYLACISPTILTERRGSQTKPFLHSPSLPIPRSLQEIADKRPPPVGTSVILYTVTLGNTLAYRSDGLSTSRYPQVRPGNPRSDHLP